MARLLSLLAAAIAATAPLAAQDRVAEVRVPRALTWRFFGFDADKARLGISIGTADTAGIPVTGVVDDGPAARAGVRAGDRLVAVDGVDLRVARADAEDPDAGEIVARRLTRHLDGKTPGTEVTLRVVRDGAPRTVRATTVRGDSLDRLSAGRPGGDRAALGLTVGGTPGKRDTLGVFVAGVVEGGPADRAGIVEGDRLAAIGAVSLKVDPADAGDPQATASRVARLTRELGRVSPGATVELTVVRDGRSRAVRVTTVRASEVGGAEAFLRGDGDGQWGLAWPRVRVLAPEVRVFRRPDGGDVEIPLDRDAREEMERAMQRARDAMERARDALERARPGGRPPAPPRRAIVL